ncbi:MAG: uroporphyrinogen-III synthase [Gammaproteobacteria bacterium]|nr:uroporphyrinogen-III synthase [Gammaproteobacteria bacterium]
MKINLSGLTVLVTRPKHQAQTLCDKLLSVQATPILFPTLEISYVIDKPPIAAAIQQLPQTDWVIFTSANAVTGMLVAQPLAWQALSTHANIIAIGTGTQVALTENDLVVDLLPQIANSTGLLALPQLQHIADQTIIIFSGEGGRQELFTALQQRQAHVTKVATYRRVLPQADQQYLLEHFSNIDVIISTSGEGLQNLMLLIDEHYQSLLLQCPLLVVSKNMLHLARNIGFKDVMLAKHAGDRAVLAALHIWQEGNNEQTNQANNRPA